MSDCYNCDIIYAVSKSISNGSHLTPPGLLPQMNCREEEDAEPIKQSFMNNTQEKIVCYGTTSWGRSQHYLYRHDDGTVYAFYVSGYIGEQPSIFGLRKY